MIAITNTLMIILYYYQGFESVIPPCSLSWKDFFTDWYFVMIRTKIL